MPDQSSDMPHESSLGKSFVGLAGLLAITLYLILAALLDFYLMIKLWPPEPPPGVSTTAAGGPSASASAPSSTPVAPGGQAPATPTTSPGSPTAVMPNGAGQGQQTVVIQQTGPIAWEVSFFWSPKTVRVLSLNTSLFLIAILSGALGSLLHSLRSLYWYAGNRKLVWSWAGMYTLLPFSGAVLSTVFYIVIRAGFVPSSPGQGPPNTPFGFAAMGALVGLFSEEAVLKLQQVAETVFTRTPPGKDHAAPAPKVAVIAPNTGPTAGGTPVIITGSDFAAGARVKVGGAPVTSITAISATSISASTPPGPAGQADVEVENADGQKGVLTGGFKYV